MKTFFLLLASFLSCYSFAQVTTLQELRKLMENEEKAFTEDDQKVLFDEDDQEEPFDNQEELFDNQEILFDVGDSDFIAPEAWDTNFDNLLNSWYITHYTNKLNNEGYRETVVASDAVYRERLSKLPNIIELPFNTTVRNCINLYIERRRDLTERMLGLEAIYFPMIEETLDKYGLPLELKYLVIIESAMNPVALSKAGASGLWQFMLSTGIIYGLEINSLIDERRDPIKSTDAACRFLKDLYDIYEDWNLAIAAYNCGGGNVNKAIRRAGGKKNYWAIYQYLPRETRSYVPYFIAANYVMNYYAHHQLYPTQSSLPFATDTVMVTQMVHFDQIADILQIDKELIRALNPQYKRDIIPGNYKPQILKLPAIQTYAFVEKENEIVSHRADEFFANQTQITGSNTVAANRTEKITHKVVRGESVLTIAHKYGVTASNVLRWNNLKSNSVAAGRNLILYVDNGGVRVQNNSSNTVSSSSTVPQRVSSATTAKLASVDTVQYRVQQGDSYYTIAQKYPGYSHTDLMILNNKTSSALKVGQYIKVPKI